MKEMPLVVLAGLSGLAACVVLVLRHARRTAVPPGLQPVSEWSGRVRPERRTGGVPVLPTHHRLPEKLRREQARQRPQEGRN